MQGQMTTPEGNDDDMRRFFMDDPAGPQTFDPSKKSPTTGINGGNMGTVTPYDHSGFRDEWLATGNDVSAQNTVAQKYGVKLDASGRATLPDGAIMDLRRGAHAGDNTAQYMGVGDAGGIYGVGGYGMSGSSSASGNAYGGNYPAGVGDAIKKLLDRGFTPPSENDPAIQAQLAPQYHAIDRGAQRTRQASAERAAGSGALIGGEGGGFDSAVNGIMEGAASQKAGAAGNVIGSEVAGRRQDIVNALQFAQGEEKMQLEKMLSDADRELRRQGLAQDNQHFYDDYAWKVSPDNNANKDPTLDDILKLLGR